MSGLATLSDILDDLRAGKMIILVDDENRENEGDLVGAAQFVSPEMINFMVKHTPGYLCVALAESECDRLDLHSQTSFNTSLRGTPMTVSVDGHSKFGVGTGISASDRARTVKVIADPDSRPDDLVRPGHMVPLRARAGGVLVRTGQTEGSVDLMKLAGLRPCAVISEVCKSDGEMARMPDLEVFAAEHDLKICSVEQIIHHRLERERLVERIEPKHGTPIETKFGRFNLIAYHSMVDPLPHLAFTLGGVGGLSPAGTVIESNEPTLVRMHRRNLLGDIFGDSAQPTNEILEASLRMIQQEGRGVLVYLRPSGVGEGLLGRLQTIHHDSLNVADSNRPNLTGRGGVGETAVPMDSRDFGVGGQILRDLGLHRLRVLTNHPRAMTNLQAFDLEIVESVAIQSPVE